MAAVLVAGGSAALAESADPGPTLPKTANEHAVVATADETTTTVDGAAPTTTTTEHEAPDAAAPKGGSSPAGNGAHGAAVSAAAADHRHDAECGNHGRYVSAVARGLATCPPATSKPGADKSDDVKGPPAGSKPADGDDSGD